MTALLAVGMAAAGLSTAHPTLAQPAGAGSRPASSGPSLLEQEPFDLITLDEANHNFELKVQPLPFPGRKKPRNPAPESKLRVITAGDEPTEYDILWRHIKRVELYEELLLKEAERLRKEGQLDEAFAYYYRLHSKYPHMRPRVEPAMHRYLYQDAVRLTRERKLNEALGVIEELYRRAANYRYNASSPTPLEFIGRLVDLIVDDYLENQKYSEARQLLERVQSDYQDDPPGSIQGWIEQLAELAASKRDEALGHLQAERYHEAIEAAEAMVDIWPEVSGAQELYAELARQYPLVEVGVLQPATMHDPHRIDNWAARRTGPLVLRSLVEFLGAGPEGGRYQFALGALERSADQRQLLFTVAPDHVRSGSAWSGYEVARRLLDMADPDSAAYLPSWGGLVASVSVEEVRRAVVQLRRPHVLPEALLTVPLDPRQADEPAETSGDGPFRIQSRDQRSIQHVNKDYQPGGQLAEVIERTYESSQQALSALRRGQIDVIDRLFPADAARLRRRQSPDSSIAVRRYALPTVHMLLIDTDHPFLADRDFRRALVFGIDRESILDGELLGGHDDSGCRVVSGPFPSGAGSQAPLAYAYDESIAVRGYAPRLARLLSLVATRRVVDAAVERGEVAPRLEPLLLGHPAHETARVAAQAVAAYLNQAGIACQLREFPPGATRDSSGECDLVYAEVAIWEPLIDARRLFAPGGIAPSDNPFVRRALRWLDQAQSWGEVRQRLLEVHRAVHSEAVIVPLWQTVDYFAHHRRLQNLGERPIWLYQHIDQWRLSGGTE